MPRWPTVLVQHKHSGIPCFDSFLLPSWHVNNMYRTPTQTSAIFANAHIERRNSVVWRVLRSWNSWLKALDDSLDIIFCSIKNLGVFYVLFTYFNAECKSWDSIQCITMCEGFRLLLHITLERRKWTLNSPRRQHCFHADGERTNKTKTKRILLGTPLQGMRTQPEAEVTVKTRTLQYIFQPTFSIHKKENRKIPRVEFSVSGIKPQHSIKRTDTMFFYARCANRSTRTDFDYALWLPLFRGNDQYNN